MALVVVVVVGAWVVALALAEVAPLVAVVEGPEVEVLALQNLASFHNGTANMVHYRRPVASHFGANRTPVHERRTQQANN